MIVEFLGVSGVGKTTTAKVYQHNLENQGEKIIWDTYAFYTNQTWFKRNIKKGVVVTKFAFTHLNWTREYFKFAYSNLNNRSDVFTILFNGIFLKSNLLKAKFDDNIHIFDEGALQHLWAIKLRNKTSVTKTDIKNIESLFGLPEQLISINAEIKTIIVRLKRRGEYVRLMNSDDLYLTIKEMQIIQNEIVRILKGKIKVTELWNEIELT